MKIPENKAVKNLFKRLITIIPVRFNVFNKTVKNRFKRLFTKKPVRFNVFTKDAKNRFKRLFTKKPVRFYVFTGAVKKLFRKLFTKKPIRFYVFTGAAKKHFKRLIIIIGIIILFVIVLILIISPLTKYLIEKYDEKLTGRQITIGRAYVNPFTGYIHLSNLKIYESNSLPSLTVSDSVFFSAKGLSINIAMLKLLSRTFEISSLKLDQPKGRIIQNKTDVNINDLVARFSAKKTDTIPSKNRFSILNIKIVNGEFHYIENIIPINYYFKDINIDSKGKHWDSDSIAINFSFLSQSRSGSIKGDFTYKLNTKEYSLAILVDKFELDLLDQYFKELSNYGALRANIDADFSSSGNLNDPETVTNKGILVINDFHLEKKPNNDYVSFKKLVVVIIEMNPKDLIYQYDSIIVTKPYIKYEKYDYLDNLQMMFGKDWSKITEVQADTTRFNLILKIVDLIKALRKNLPKSDFQFNRVAMDKGIIEFNDYSQSEKFSIVANPLSIAADSIYKTRDRVQILLKSGFNPHGELWANVSINPKGGGSIKLDYQLKGFPVPMFNPYIISNTSFPLKRGTLELNGKWEIRDGEIKSNNHLLVIDPHVGKRIRNEDTDWLPMRLIMVMLRDKGNVIDIEIPITGNLKDPEFSLNYAISDVIRNIFTRASSTRYRTIVKNVEIVIDTSLSLNWEMRQNLLLSQQERFLITMADHLENNPKISIDVYPTIYAEKEKEHISFFEAKKRHFILLENKDNQTLSHTDSLKVNKISAKDSIFGSYLNSQVNTNLLFTVQDKSNTLIGYASIEAKLKRLNQERENAFMAPFRQNGVEDRVTIHPVQTATPYNRFSNYKIVYSGKLPKQLVRAYKRMEE